MLTAPFILPDEQLEHWARVYLAMPWLCRRGITFERFLSATPQVRESGSLPALVVRSRLDELARQLADMAARHRSFLDDLERGGASCANGRMVERLKHHRYPRSHRDFLPGTR